MIKDDILAFYKEISPESYNVEDLAYLRGIKSTEALEAFFDIINELTEAGQLVETKPEYYTYAEDADVVEGIYKGYRQSFGFVVTPDRKEDIYISEYDRHTAMHNDKVRVRITKLGLGDKKTEGVVIDVLDRANTRIVGTYDRQKTFGFVKPDDERIGVDVYVNLEDTLNARSGAKVLVEITKWPEEDKRPEGKITEILGYEGDVGLDINCIMANHNIPFSFPEKVLAASENIFMEVKPDADRLDLRDVQMVTIDGEDAKDLDDAVSAKQLPNGNYELGVHIADVSHYVPTKSVIDKEAYKRGTSVYLVDRVVPMLPEVLSNGICSLNAHEDRYAMTCLMEINGTGKVVKFKISPSIINVGRRCSYKEVFKALTEDIIPEDLLPFMGMLNDLYNISKCLYAMRHKRGAIDFDFPEYRILIDKTGKPLQIIKRERTIAERIIEECMLIANETVATFLRDTENPSVYRIHERPVEEKLQNLETVVNYLGEKVSFDAETVEPKAIQNLLTKLQGSEIEKIAQIMTLRSMQQAKYSTENVGHFGLASTCYTHFTSPIRRYPDLMVHRLLKKTLQWKDGWKPLDGDGTYLAAAAEHASQQEQVAVEAERETDDLKKTEYMLPFLGEVFTAKVSSILSFGMFVELENGIDGLVHISLMDDDFYTYDEEHFLLVGQRTGKIYSLGQEVTVTLAKVDLERKQIDFVLGEVEDITQLKGRLERYSSGSRSMLPQSRKSDKSQGKGRHNKLKHRNDRLGAKSGKSSRRHKHEKAASKSGRKGKHGSKRKKR